MDKQTLHQWCVFIMGLVVAIIVVVLVVVITALAVIVPLAELGLWGVPVTAVLLIIIGAFIGMIALEDRY